MEPNEMRLQELEIKCTFLEKELGEWKEASRELYGKISKLEQEVRNLSVSREEDIAPMSPSDEQLGYQPQF